MEKKEEKSEYAIQLMEKQKAKYSYGILEAIQRFIQKSISY
jgi:ribosomal protein S4